jgi:hypothetical protein
VIENAPNGPDELADLRRRALDVLPAHPVDMDELAAEDARRLPLVGG